MTTQTTDTSPLGSGVRRESTRRKGFATPNLNHLAPQPFLDPIRQVKRESIHWKRKVFHVIGIGAVGFTYLFTQVSALQAVTIMGAIAALFVTLDALRFWVPALNKKVKRDFGPFMRDYELDGLSGSSWFFFASLLTIGLFPKVAAGLGIVYLALGDPVASFVGVRWGRTTLPGGKSLEGSLALAGLCSAVGAALLLTLTTLSAPVAVGVALVTAGVAAVAEWLPVKKLDDNFVVPLLTGGVAALLLALV